MRICWSSFSVFSVSMRAMSRSVWCTSKLLTSLSYQRKIISQFVEQANEPVFVVDQIFDEIWMLLSHFFWKIKRKKWRSFLNFVYNFCYLHFEESRIFIIPKDSPRISPFTLRTINQNRLSPKNPVKWRKQARNQSREIAIFI